MVTILLSTFNGQRFLDEQINSLVSQKYKNIRIFARDDGSSDDTQNILDKWQSICKLQWYQGENLRPCSSFFDLIKKAPKSEYYAFCDQDDVWLPEKIESAVNSLSPYSDIPCLYFGQTQMVDASLSPIETKKIHPQCNLVEALIRSIVTGCTLVINWKLMEIIRLYIPSSAMMHDSWIYKVCLSIGGKVIFDAEPYILYRQHGDNVIGLTKNRKRDIKRMFNNSVIHSLRIRSNEVAEIYEHYAEYIPDSNVQLLFDIAHYSSNFKSKLRLLFNKSFKDSSIFKTIKLKLLLFFNKY